MMFEGVGHREPEVEVVQLSRGDIALIGAHAEQREKFHGYRFSSNRWRSGLIKNATRVGMIGEQGVCAYINRRIGTKLRVDTLLKRKGDGGIDINVCGLWVQVKTSFTHERNLIRRINDRRGGEPIVCHAYVFCRFSEPSTVEIRGWIKSTDARDVGELERSGVSGASHINLCIPSKNLVGMSRLLDEIRLKQLEGCK